MKLLVLSGWHSAAVRVHEIVCARLASRGQQICSCDFEVDL